MPGEGKRSKKGGSRKKILPTEKNRGNRNRRSAYALRKRPDAGDSGEKGPVLKTSGGGTLNVGKAGKKW